jgi:hypothetical protein
MMNEIRKSNQYRLATVLVGAAVFVVSLAPRVLLAVFDLAVTPDGSNYQVVASNILNNGCVSMEDPSIGSCLPHWGGNQFPGFPAFIAFVWMIFPKTWTSITIAHSAVFSLSILYLWFALDSYLKERLPATLIAILVAMSPLSMPWARFTLGDTLSLAVVVVITAELIRSLAQGKIRIPIVGLTLCVGFFIRFDTIFLSIPVAVVGFYLHSIPRAFRRGSAILIILMLPVLMWSGRGISAGLGPFPDPFFSGNSFRTPVGYLAWARNWATSQYQAPMWWYPIGDATYSKIVVPHVAFKTKEQKAKVDVILGKLKSYDGQPFPKKLDDRFQEIALEMKNSSPLDYWLSLPLKRVGLIWFNPLNSAGWPVDVGWTNGIPDFANLVNAIISNPMSALIKGGTSTYRAGLPLIALLLVLLFRARMTHPTNILIIASLIHIVARSVFLGWGFYIESRYLLQLFPMLEMSLLLGFHEFLRGRNKTV